MRVKTTRNPNLIHKASPKQYTQIEDAAFTWTFDENEINHLEKDKRSEELKQELKGMAEGEHRFYDPEACCRMFFLATSELSSREETDPLWRMYDAILVCAYNGAIYQTGMEIAV